MKIDVNFIVMVLACALGAYRFAHAFTLENGPFNLFFRIRETSAKKFGYDSWQAEFTRCAWCQSFWWSFFVALFIFGISDLKFLIAGWWSSAGLVLLIHGKLYKIFGS